MPQRPSSVSRRVFFTGAASVGAAAVAAAALPLARASQPEAQSKPAPPRGGGYRLSEHVKRYYKTTLV